MCGPHHLSRLLACSSLLLAIGLSTTSIAQSALRQQMDTLSAATSLDRDGFQPWHMRLTFDLFDLKGKPQESGTIEEWWVSTDRARIVITSPSLNETMPGTPVTSGREAYLVHELLREVVHPMLRKKAEQFVAAVAPRNFGQTSLSCTTLKLKNIDNPTPDQFCTDPGTNTLRLVFTDGFRSDALNDISSALSTQVAMMHTIAYVGHPAIKGHIESIEPFDPAHTDVQLGALTPPENASLTSPQLLHRATPIYPKGARESGDSGFTVLHIRILADGKLGPIDTIATSGSSFTEAVTDAMSHWDFTPMTRNGSPAECDYTVSVTFRPPSKTVQSWQVEISANILPY